MSAIDYGNWSQQLRYRLIEILALWEGRVSAPQIAAAFGIGREQAQKVLRRYREEVASGNLTYDASLKTFVPAPAFTPRVTQGTLDEYLHLLGSHESLDTPFAGLGVEMASAEAIPMPSRAVSPAVVRSLTRAIRERQRLEVVYASFNHPDGEERILVPHVLVLAAGRWHVRAYCEKHRAFRDFVLTRFCRLPEPLGARLDDTHGADHDHDWRTVVTVRLIPDRRLSAPERRMLEMDFSMQHGELTLHCRGPLVRYALRQLGVNPYHVEADPRAQQLEIANRHTLQQWIDW